MTSPLSFVIGPMVGVKDFFFPDVTIKLFRIDFTLICYTGFKISLTLLYELFCATSLGIIFFFVALTPGKLKLFVGIFSGCQAYFYIVIPPFGFKVTNWSSVSHWCT